MPPQGHASGRQSAALGSGLEISFFAYRGLRYHLADGSIMNFQIIRNLFQSIFMIKDVAGFGAVVIHEAGGGAEPVVRPDSHVQDGKEYFPEGLFS